MKYLISLVLGLATVSWIEANSCETTLCPAGQVCQMQRVQCVRAPCNDIPVCVENPCNRVDCPQGQRCELREVQCFTTPCNPQPTCVPDEHPGTCPEPSGLAGICLYNPDVNCLSDSACAPDEKCCSEGCGKVCKKALYTLPVPVGPTVDPECAAILCMVGTECRREPIPCLVPPCPTRVGCFSPRTNVVNNPCITMKCSRGFECRVQTCRPGTSDPCPLLGVCKPMSTASNPCSIGKPILSATSNGEIFCGRGPNREECPRGTSCNIHPTDRYAVCCLNSSPSPVPSPKLGTCPTPSGFGMCVDLCSSDSMCPGTQKCCSNGCGHVCMEPESSQAPRRRCCQRAPLYCRPRGSYRPRRCEEDEDCPGGGKCCRTRQCGKICVPGRRRVDRRRRRRRE